MISLAFAMCISYKVIMKIDVLGTKYNLRRVNFDQDEFMRKMNYGGYCDNNTKEIVILNLKSTPDWASAQEEVIQRMEKCTIRHELVHAFSMSPAYSGTALPRKRLGPKMRKWWTGLPFRPRKCLRLSGWPGPFEVISWIIRNSQRVSSGILKTGPGTLRRTLTSFPSAASGRKRIFRRLTL